MALRTVVRRLGVVSQSQGSRHAAPLHSRSSVRAFASSSSSFGMTPLDKFLFDTNGYIVLPQVFTKDEINSANAAIQANSNKMLERIGGLRNTEDDTPLVGDGTTGRQDLSGFLGWPEGQRDVFRRVLDHPRLVPYVTELLGMGYRLDHMPLILIQRPGSEGFQFHGGPLDGDGRPNQYLSYKCHNGTMQLSLLAVAVQLTDVNEGEGGFCIIKGSHKSNFPCPKSVVNYEEAKEHAYQPVTRAGDVVLFSEATIHGTLPWSGKSDRRLALFRFSPANYAYGRGYTGGWPDSWLDGMTDTQRLIMEPPYNHRLDRKSLKMSEDGKAVSVETGSRADFKKEFDEAVFGRTYF